jgi:hypothetical protein
MQAEYRTGKPKFITLEPFPSVMALAPGHKVSVYTPTDGTSDGEDLLASMIGEDRGNTRAWLCRVLG